MTRLLAVVAARRPRLLLLAAMLGALSALALVAPAAAQETATTASPIGGSVSGYGVAEWVNLILRLGLVLIIIWLAIMAMRWWVRRMNGGVAAGGGHLQVLETRSLGPNRSLQLVKLGNRAVLIGVTNERISSVLEIDDPIEVERLGRPHVAKDSPTSFRDAVSRLGSLTRWRPVIERRQAAPRPTAPARSAGPPVRTQMNPVVTTAQRSVAPAGPRSVAPAGLRSVAPAGLRSVAPAGLRSVAPAGLRSVVSTGGQRSVVPTGQRSRWLTLARQVIGLEDGPAPRPPAAQAPRSFAAASAAAAELPASRTVRARSGYRQNQIAEAQRAIASVRAEMTR